MSLLSPDAVRFIGSAAPRHGSEVHAAEGPPIDRGYVTRLAQVHERGGFERNPVAFHATASDALLLASAHIAAVTERIGLARVLRDGTGITPGLGFAVANETALRDKRGSLADFARRLARARLSTRRAAIFDAGLQPAE